MTKAKNKVKEMLKMVSEIIKEADHYAKAHGSAIEEVHPNFRKSAINLLHYRSLRMKDIRPLQKKLGHMGLSRLAKAESHVMASLKTTENILQHFNHATPLKQKRPSLSIKEGNKLLNANARQLLGHRSKGRRTRIMVTQPTESSENYELVKEMIAHGMNIARINCAHDGPDVWLKMIQHIHKANKLLKKNCLVAMDLGGPKIRTGELEAGPRIVKISPVYDIRGQVIQPTKIWLGEARPLEEGEKFLPISLTEDADKWVIGKAIYFKDTRSKKRKIKIFSLDTTGAWAYSYETAYIEEGTPIFSDAAMKKKIGMIKDLPAIEQKIVLNQGDTLRLDRAQIPGAPAVYDEKGNVLQDAHVSCTSEEIFGRVKLGETVLFDDGKIVGEIKEVHEDHFLIRITYAKAGGGKLKADKGINFPSSDLNIRGLTPKDKKDLAFVLRHADIVNMSFVNQREDIEDLMAEISHLNVDRKLGIILKIETQQGFNNLTEILLEAMKMYPVGVMIARGDLAIEVGWENIARVQEEILSLCQAAHIPDIWATQVLESLAKKGIPSRAEITDVAMAQRAECVMLNKGPSILSAIQLLGSILRDMSAYQEKDAPLLPAMKKANT